MNEVTKINLGRQVFTIAADAHTELRNYLDEINRQVKDKDVTYEVELRMAELLAGSGISGDKVILKKDVESLKEQLGSPKDFKDEDNEDDTQEVVVTNKRLFRDTDNAMIAGVAAGLGSYFGIDALLFRILFVILLVVTFGWGLLVYILLWLLVPEAKTASDRLQMSGKAVTVESLKGIAKNADIKGVASRTNSSLSGPINRALRIILKLCGGLLVIGGLSVIFGLIAGLVYFLTESSKWSKYNIFPIGTSEHVLLYIGMSVAALLAVFVILFGVAIFRRKWPVGNWITGTLLGLTLIGITVSGALGATVYPNVRDAYNANTHTTTRSLPKFSYVNTDNDGAWDTSYVYANSYFVTFNYFGKPNLSTISTNVNNNVLYINTNRFDWQRNCPILCVPRDYNLNITIHAPNYTQLENNEGSGPYQVEPNPMKPWRI